MSAEAKGIRLLSSGMRLEGVLRLPDERYAAPYPAVVFIHGYSGNMLEYDEMAGYLCLSGFATLQFNLRGCSAKSQKGRMLCATEWPEDAMNAVSYLAGLAEIDANRIGITGCSMGGAITLMMAALDPRIKCAAAMAPVGDGRAVLERAWTKNKSREDFEAFLKELETDMRQAAESGISRIVDVPYALCFNQKDDADYRQYRDEHPDMVSCVPLYSVFNSFLFMKPLNHCADIRIPVLLLHGDADEIVEKRQSEEIQKRISAPCELKIVRGAPHPLPVSEQAGEVFEAAAGWFAKYL